MTALLPQGGAEELAALRRRAYGPGADIDSDPVALARLRELEQAQPAPAAKDARSPRPVAGPSPVAVVPATSEESGSPPDAVSHTGAASTDDTVPTGAPALYPRRWWRRPATIVVAIAVALVVVVASLTVAGGGRPERTLSATPVDSEIPFPDRLQWLTSALGISRDALRSYRGVGDIVVWAGTTRDGVDCVLVTGTDGPFGFGCSREGDATADVVLDSELASIPAQSLPERTTIRFVYRGDRVDVWITEP